MKSELLIFLAVAAMLGVSTGAEDTANEPEEGGRTPESCQGDERFHNGWCVVDPRIIKKSVPKYPKRAKKERVEATVKLKAIIQENGRVTDPRVTECSSSGYGFEKSATRAVKHWKYIPARVDGEIRAVYFDVIVDFKLE